MNTYVPGDCVMFALFLCFICVNFVNVKHRKEKAFVFIDLLFV